MSETTETKAMISGTVVCAICGVAITEENIDFHRVRLCEQVEKVPKLKLENFEILKHIYETYSWLKRPRSPDDNRVKAKDYEVDNYFQHFLSVMFDYLYTAGKGWYKSGVQMGCKAGGSCFRIKIWYVKPDDVKYASTYSHRLVTDVPADLMLEIKTWLNAVYLIDAIIKKQTGLDYQKILIEMVTYMQI